MKKFLHTSALILAAVCSLFLAAYAAEQSADIPTLPIWTGIEETSSETPTETESETEEETESETEAPFIDRELLRQALLVLRLKYGPEFTFALRSPEVLEENDSEQGNDSAGIPRFSLKDSREMRDYPLPALPKTIHDLEESIAALTESYSGSWSVYVKNLTTEDTLIVNDQPMKSASIMKLFIMAAVYDAIDREELERTSELTDQLNNMISYSSNEAANRLLILLGGGDLSAGVSCVNHYIQKHDYSSATHEYNGFQDADTILDSEHFNQVTAVDCGLLLERVYHRTFSSRRVCNEIEEMMLKQQTRYKIPRGLPEDVSVGNKTGEMDTVENDVAIVYAPKCDYILCVFSSDWISKDRAQQNIQEISSVVYAFFNDDHYYRPDNPSFLELLPENHVPEPESEVEAATGEVTEAEVETGEAAEAEAETGEAAEDEVETEEPAETETAAEKITEAETVTQPTSKTGNRKSRAQ